MMPRWAKLLLLGGLLAVLACTGVPEPVPIPAPDGRLLRASSVPPDGSDGPVHLVGLPGSVSGAGRVSAERDGSRFETQATEAGSFSLPVSAKRGDTLLVRFESSEPTAYEVRDFAGFITPPPPHALPGVPPLSDAVSGKVTIRGESEPSAATFAVNMSTGDVSVSTADAAGAFALTIAAQPGQLLWVYVDATPLAPPWELTVP